MLTYINPKYLKFQNQASGLQRGWKIALLFCPTLQVVTTTLNCPAYLITDTVNCPTKVITNTLNCPANLKAHH